MLIDLELKLRRTSCSALARSSKGSFAVFSSKLEYLLLPIKCARIKAAGMNKSVRILKLVASPKYRRALMSYTRMESLQLLGTLKDAVPGDNAPSRGQNGVYQGILLGSCSST